MAKRKQYRKRPISEREFLFTLKEVADLVGKHVNHVRNWSYQYYGDFPKLPTTKTAVWAFMLRHDLPQPHRPGKRRLEVVRLREEGLTWALIAARLGICRQVAQTHWNAYHRTLRLRAEKALRQRSTT